MAYSEQRNFTSNILFPSKGFEHKIWNQQEVTLSVMPQTPTTFTLSP